MNKFDRIFWLIVIFIDLLLHGSTARAICILMTVTIVFAVKMFIDGIIGFVKAFNELSSYR